MQLFLGIASFLFTTSACALYKAVGHESVPAKPRDTKQGYFQPLITFADDNECSANMATIKRQCETLCEPVHLQSNLLRTCLRLHNQLEGILSLNMVSTEEWCQVVDECSTNGNISGLILLYRLVKEAGREVEFLNALKRYRSELSINLSSTTQETTHTPGVPRPRASAVQVMSFISPIQRLKATYQNAAKDMTM